MRSVWATHNKSPQIQKALNQCLSRLALGGRGLNVGAGATDLHPSLVNIDVVPGPAIHVRASAMDLPFQDEAFDLVMSQEVVEHVNDPLRALCEMRRVLRKGGSLYFQVPFVIGYHPGPTDFWRFTREGALEIVRQAGFAVEQVGMAVGPATAFYRVAVEFLATALAGIWARLYIPVKVLLALLFYPTKWLDPVLSQSPQSDRIAGGYFVIARR